MKIYWFQWKCTKFHRKNGPPISRISSVRGMEPMAEKQMFNFRSKAGSIGQMPRAHHIYPITGVKKKGNIFPKILGVSIIALMELKTSTINELRWSVQANHTLYILMESVCVCLCVCLAPKWAEGPKSEPKAQFGGLRHPQGPRLCWP